MLVRPRTDDDIDALERVALAVQELAGAIALYERCGWARAGRVTVTFGDFTFEEFVFLAPVA